MITGYLDNQLAIDANALAEVKRQAKDDPRAGLKLAAQQFEAIFLHMVLKAMREAVPRSGMLDGDAGQLYEEMFDRQLAQVLAGRATTGLAALLEKQLGAGLPAPSPAETTPVGGADDAASAIVPPSGVSQGVLSRGSPTRFPEPAPEAKPADIRAAPRAASSEAVPADAKAFVNRLWPYALEASRSTDIPAHFLIAHAALETGWGRAEIRRADGTPSYNLFNVKAGRNWPGATVDTMTTEFIDGAARKRVERFRAYGSYAEAFADYANLIRGRFAQVVGARESAAFARGLQQAGYATDPMYAEKLTRIIGGATLRAGLAG